MATVAQNNTLSPTSQKSVRSNRRRAHSHLTPSQTPESHEAALQSIRTYLRHHTSYDAFPVSFRMIVLDTKLEVKKALQCLLLNGMDWNSLSRTRTATDPKLDQVSYRRHFGTVKNVDSPGC